MGKIGIDALSFYVPQLYVSIEHLAQHRDLPFEKLTKGLGLQQMAIPDVNEDAASFAANALINLFNDYDLNPKDIGRIYLGTESALDASKPTATYALEALENNLSEKFGERCFKNCDVVDMTFACIGAVDALHNSLDWVRNDPKRKAIVVASDLSKYDLQSTGEYTQGAGAVALLITHNPTIMSIDDTWGVATKSEGDFFKPRRRFNKKIVLKEILSHFNSSFSEEEMDNLISKSGSEFWNDQNESIEIFKEEPIFDGQYSNLCYSQRMSEALEHFHVQKPINFHEEWQHFIFHLPYAYHGRRMLFKNWLEWIKNSSLYQELTNEIGKLNNKEDWLKRASKSKTYFKFVNERIAPGEKASSAIGNMYTASIFMSLLSMLSHHLLSETEISGHRVGFISYGSGSKSKVFQGQIQKGWKTNVARIKLFEQLAFRTEIDIETYEKLHKNQITEPVLTNNLVTMSHIETTGNNRGLRRYALN